ncbi:MAG: MFS transporter [Planctomycetaceae bacterium]|nr:MFS transporter [Planctomycetaceae bacterium]
MDPTPRPLVKDPRYEWYRWQIFAITWLAYAGFYLTRKAFSIAKIGLAKDAAHGGLAMPKSDMGWIDGGFLAAYAIGQFVWGIAADKVGTRKVVLLGLVGSIAASIAMGASTWVVIIGIFLIIQGLCQSTGWGPLSKNFAAFFSQRERGTMMGIWSTSYAAGGLFAGWFAGFCADKFAQWGYIQSWRFAFFVPAGALLIVTVLFFIFQRNKPEDVGLVPVEEYHGEKPPVIGTDAQQEREGSWKTIWEVITNRTVMLLCAAYFLLKPTRYAILLWGPKYANEKLGSGMAESGLISGLFEAAGIVSCIAGGWVSDKVFGSRRMPVCVICLAALGVGMFFFDHLPAQRWVLSLAFFVMGMLLFAPDSIVSGTAALDFGTRKGASTAAGLVNGFGSVAAILGGMLPGFSDSKTTGWGWNMIFTFLAVMLLLSATMLVFKWNVLPNKPKPQAAATQEQELAAPVEAV